MNLYEINFRNHEQGELITTNFIADSFDEAYVRFKKWKPNATITLIKQTK